MCLIYRIDLYSKHASGYLPSENYYKLEWVQLVI